MIKHIGTKIAPLTRDLASRFATMTAAPGERPLKEKRVQFLRNELESGQFFSPKWATAQLGDRTYRVNGQHSSHMLTQANGSFPSGLSVIIDEFSVDSEAELGELFTRFDPPESVRPPREQFAAILAGSSVVGGAFSRNKLERIASGMLLAKSDFASRTGSAHARAAVLHGDPGFITFAEQFIGRRAMNRPAVLAAMYLTWLRDAHASQAFWTQVRDETALSANDATRVLARFLRERGTGGPLSGEEGRAVCVKCVHAWNNWRRGHEVARLLDRGGHGLPEAL